jgi:hypothetical protein
VVLAAAAPLPVGVIPLLMLMEMVDRVDGAALFESEAAPPPVLCEGDDVVDAAAEDGDEESWVGEAVGEGAWVANEVPSDSVPGKLAALAMAVP